MSFTVITGGISDAIAEDGEKVQFGRRIRAELLAQRRRVELSSPHISPNRAGSALNNDGSLRTCGVESLTGGCVVSSNRADASHIRGDDASTPDGAHSVTDDHRYRRKWRRSFPKPKPLFLAEREGFEPSVPGKEYARLAIRPADFTSRDPVGLNRKKCLVVQGLSCERSFRSDNRD
jgi:hypothetical protein